MKKLNTLPKMNNSISNYKNYETKNNVRNNNL
jgi:hypothetical protein